MTPRVVAGYAGLRKDVSGRVPPIRNGMASRMAHRFWLPGRRDLRLRLRRGGT